MSWTEKAATRISDRINLHGYEWVFAKIIEEEYWRASSPTATASFVPNAATLDYIAGEVERRITRTMRLNNTASWVADGEEYE